MKTWTPAELAALDDAYQIRVAGRRKDGSARTLTIVWQVVVDDILYLRSVRGPEGQWYKGVLHYLEGVIEWGGQTRDVTYTHHHSQDEAIDAAYFAKYGTGSATTSITNALAKQTTLRADPR